LVVPSDEIISQESVAMYQIHTTPGLIIEARPSGEAGKILSIFTRDLGLIRASAQGIRLEKSKLRYVTQEYSLGVYSVVRGREYWRLTGGETLAISGGETSGRVHCDLSARLALLLRRLLHGEEPNQRLFERIEQCYRYGGATSVSLSAALESLTVLRILEALGYIGADPILDTYTQSQAITAELVAQAHHDRLLINRHINQALRESHL
jgi:DNA repair protein RecO